MANREPLPENTNPASDGQPGEQERRSLREQLAANKRRLIALGMSAVAATGIAFAASESGVDAHQEATASRAVPTQEAPMHKAPLAEEAPTQETAPGEVQLGGQESARVVEATKAMLAPMGSLIAASREGALSPQDTFTWTAEKATEPYGEVTRFQIDYTGPQPEEADGRSHVALTIDVNGTYPDEDSALAALGTVLTPVPTSFKVDSAKLIGKDGDVGFDISTRPDNRSVFAKDITGAEAGATDAIVAVDAAVGAEAVAEILGQAPTIQGAN